MKRRRTNYLVLVTAFLGLSCDSVYRYVFYPPERTEYTLVADPVQVRAMNDTAYYIGKDSLSVGYDRKDYKVEVKCLTDYQLNNFEFPEESRSGEFSANPFTYANWVDPALGSTPNRFTVFKVSIYNYTASKINFDPENTLLTSDRGDNLLPYGREDKNSRYHSFESYYKKRKGSSGSDDETFDSRLGIVRKTLLYLGRPIFRGDSREGLVVYDPLTEGVNGVRVSFTNFILGYDENNEPNEFANMVFFFKRVPFIKDKLGKPPEKIASASPKPAASTSSTSSARPTTPVPQKKAADTSSIDTKNISGDVTLCQLQYRSAGGDPAQEVWNMVPTALPNLVDHVNNRTSLRATLIKAGPESKEIFSSTVVFIIGGLSKPELSEGAIDNLAEYVRKGGFLVIDDANVSRQDPFNQSMRQFLESLAISLGGKSGFTRIPATHAIYSVWEKFARPPVGEDETNPRLTREKYDYLEGVMWNDKLVAVMSSKGYSKAWGEWPTVTKLDNTNQLQFGVNLIIYAMVKEKIK
jgi:hypothetical protein